MKKMLSALLSALLLFCTITACAPADKEYFVFSANLSADAEKPVDTVLLDAHLTSNDTEDYAKAKEKNPDILSLFKNITPDEVQDRFSVYLLEWGTGTEHLDRTYLIFDEKVYVLSGKYARVGQFACYGNMLYYSMDGGSGLFRFVICSFDLRSKKLRHSDVIGSGANPVVFFLSEDKKTISIEEVEFGLTVGGQIIKEPKRTILYTDIRDIKWE